MSISIHAPSRERPGGNRLVFTHPAISIHAPSRERHRCYWFVWRQGDFNPRSLTGATLLFTHDIVCQADFNPRSLTGATMQMPASRLRLAVFQSTLPHGSDFGYRRNQFIGVISIHAPSRERHSDNSAILDYIIFQSTLPHGSDGKSPALSLSSSDFNPRSLTGATWI